jgi:hypothetical protein
MSGAEASRHLDVSRATWMARNRRTWTLDLGILTGAGIELMTAPPDAATRLRVASATEGRPLA